MNGTAAQNSPSEAAPTLCSLSRVKTGMVVRVKRLIAAPETCQRLRELGLNEESIIRLIARQATLICQVRNARLAFSETLARSILVESLDASPCA